MWECSSGSSPAVSAPRVSSRAVPLPYGLLPSLSVLPAPPATGGVATFVAQPGPVGPLQLAFFGVFVVMALVQIASLKAYLRLPFSLGFRSFTFPVSASANYRLHRLGETEFDGPGQARPGTLGLARAPRSLRRRGDGSRPERGSTAAVSEATGCGRQASCGGDAYRREAPCRQTRAGRADQQAGAVRLSPGAPEPGPGTARRGTGPGADPAPPPDPPPALSAARRRSPPAQPRANSRRSALNCPAYSGTIDRPWGAPG